MDHRAMKALAWLLAATTLASGWATIHYSRELQQQQSSAATSRSTAGGEPAPRQDVAPAEVASIPDVLASPVEAAPAAAATLDPRRAAQARLELEQLRDPQKRAELQESITTMQRTALREIAPHIGMQAEEVEPLVDAMTPQLMQMQERLLECRLVATCDSRALEESLERATLDEVGRHIGADRLERFETYNDSDTERAFLERMRSELPPASQSSDDDVVRVAMALADERRQFVRNAEARGEQWEAIHPRNLGAYTLYSTVPPDMPLESPARLESATRYAERLLARVDGMLDAAGMAALRESQDQALATYKRQLAEREVVEAARRAAGGTNSRQQ